MFRQRLAVGSVALAQLLAGPSCDEQAAEKSPRRRLERPTQLAPEKRLPTVSTPEDRGRAPRRSFDLPDANTQAFEFAPPETKLQSVACDAKGFVHLTRHGFRAYRNFDFKLVADARIPRLSNVATLAGSSWLLLGREGVYRYYYGQSRPRAFARVPQLGPSEIWPNPRDINQFWLRYVRDDALHLFSLEKQADLSQRMSDEALGLQPRPIRLNLGEPFSLPGFREGPFTFLADGDALYVTARGLRRVGVAASRDLPPVPGTVVHLLPDHRLDRYIVANSAGLVRQMEISRGLPIRASLQLSGLAFTLEARGAVLAAVVLVQGGGRARRWRLEIYQEFKLRASWDLPDDVGLRGDWVQRVTANRDLCLFPNKPWVLLGGRDGVVVYDYRARRSLFSSLQ